MGSKGGTTQQTSSSSGPPPQVMAEYQGLVNRATNVANQPYQPYQGEQVAPLTDQTQQGLGGISDYANSAQPYYGAAGAMTLGASAPVNPEQFQGMGSLSQYMNPYTQSVVDTTQAEMNNQNQQQAQFLNSANISSGAFGGDRAGIGQSILANQQQLAEAPTIAGLNQANYTQAMSNWTGQQGVNLAAQQANAARQMTGAAQLGGLGTAAQTAGLQGSQAQIQAGMIPQQEQQAIDTAAQQMYQTGQAYPFTTTGWLGNIIEGTGGLSGGSRSDDVARPQLALARHRRGHVRARHPRLAPIRRARERERRGDRQDLRRAEHLPLQLQGRSADADRPHRARGGLPRSWQRPAHRHGRPSRHRLRARDGSRGRSRPLTSRWAGLRWAARRRRCHLARQRRRAAAAGR